MHALDMRSLDLFEDEVGGTVFRDVIMLALAGFVALVVLLLPHLNPPTRAGESTPPPGNVIIEIRWPDQFATDVDLWVEAPGDAPVGYSNKGGLVFNLLRDDLGSLGDPTELNYEVSYSRGVPAGEYTVNLHLYRNTEGVYPVPVMVIASVKKAAADPARRLLLEKVQLLREGEEITVFRFSLDAEGVLVPGSVHGLYRPLRAAAA
ncbi:MAG: hypothetical protein ACE5LL_08160 [Alphaproteobacteria bacterium]